MSGFLDNFELADGTGWKAAAQAAPAALAGYQAIRAKRDYGNKVIEIDNLLENRQQLNNPYANMSNPFANLSVATGAAEIQIEEADVSLANTLDTMRATGAGAGGATALAQAALRSKKSVSASIEAQEKTNQDKMAAGEQAMQRQKMAEAQRLQQADVSGEQFMFSTREGRELQQLDRTAAMLGAANQAEAQAASDKTGAITGAFGSLGQIAGGYMAAQS